MRRAPFFWGVLLILAGILFWMDNLHLLPAGLRAWDLLWPLALILVGVWLLIRRLMTPAAGEVPELMPVRVPLAEAQMGHLVLHQGVGRLDLDGMDSADTALEGTCAGGVELETRAGREIEVRLRQPQLSFSPFETGSPLHWELHLTSALPWRLDIHLGMGETELNLAQVRLSELSLHGGVGNTRLRLPYPTGEGRVHLENGMGELNVTLPPQVAFSLRAERGLGDLSIEYPGLVLHDAVYETPDFAQATHRFVMHLKAGVGRVSVTME